MRGILISLGALALATAPASLLAQEPVAAQAAPAPAETSTEIDPARLVAAQQTIDHIFPAGTYGRIMDGAMKAVMDNVMGSIGKMQMRDLGAIGGLDEKQLDDLGQGTLDDIMAIYDPAFHQRMDITMKIMMGEMTTLMTQFEPGIRDGLARAYARRFSADQLADLNRFFATPSGRAYAADSMLLFMDPEVMQKMQAFMPQMMKQMPGITKKFESATASLPKPRTYKDLTKAERAKLAKLLGITEAQLAKQQH